MDADESLPNKYLSFSGEITSQLSSSFRAALSEAVNDGAREVTVLFSSAGGSTDEAISLFTFLRALPVRITMHACGVVGSVAVPVFLAAASRFASSNACFFLHQYAWTFANGQETPYLKIRENILLLQFAQEWSLRIIKETTGLTDEAIQLRGLFLQPQIITAAQAAQLSLSQIFPSR